MPSVNRLYEEFKSRGFEVRLVDFREGRDLVARTAKDRGYTAPVLLDESGDVTGRLYGVWGPPSFYLVDRVGRLVGHGAGPRDWDSRAARALIEALLAEPAR